MSNRTRQRALEHALDAALIERAAAERHPNKQKGFPVNQHGGALLRRMAKRLDPR
jgi:hypothetical protein